jgi:tripartite-type tricarboxylate transporter receptor subunit TctC
MRNSIGHRNEAARTAIGMAMFKSRAFGLSTLLVAVLALLPQAHADDFYKGKLFTIVVGFSPAGGYDNYARVLSRYIGNHIPGNPTVIVQNMPGAGSLTSVRYLNLTAPKDGTVMVIFNPGMVTHSIIQPDKINLDFRRYAWVGVVTPDYRVCYGYGDRGPKSWDEMMHRKEFILGSTGKSSGNYINGATLREVFHAPIRQIMGYPGSAEQRLAIEQGALDGDCGSYSSIPLEWISKNLAHSFIRFTRQRVDEVPESAVYIGSFAKGDEQQQLLDLLNGGDEVGRPFIMSKDVPADHLAIIRKAFDDTMKDPAFLAEMEKQQLPVHPLTGEQAEKLVNGLVDVSPAIVALAKPIYE